MARNKVTIQQQDDDFVEEIEKATFQDIIDERYMNYTFHVMEDRAIPDARDGLKPVQRRILYGMKDLNSKASGSTTKSAKIVGHVMGNYHPHGDSAIYETLVNMTQDWKARCPLTIGQGNWGSIHGHPAAAQRYTECKLSKFGEFVIDDVNNDIVPFEPNYNDELFMPTVLPSRLPNLLVNGTSGIAVGVATKIPPHNLNEISKLVKGKGNPMYGKSIYEVWVKKYGKNIAETKMSKFKKLQSKLNSGENNSMYGKPSPKNSGNGM